MCNVQLGAFRCRPAIHSSSRPARVHAVTSQVPRAASIENAVPVSSCTRVFKFPRHRRNCAALYLILFLMLLLKQQYNNVLTVYHYHVQLHARSFLSSLLVKSTGKYLVERLLIARFIVWFQENISLDGAF